MSDNEIKYSLFQRSNGRWVMTIARGETWKRAQQIQAPAEVKGGSTARPSPAAKLWAKELLKKIATNGGKVPDRVGGSPSLRACHAQLMKVREGLPDRKAATLENNWTHLRAQILTEDFADIPMARADVTDARKIVRTVRARVAPNYCRNVFSTLRMLWDCAEAEGIVKSNPFRNALVVAEVPAAQTEDELDGEIDPITVPLAGLQAIIAAPAGAVPLERRVLYVLAAVTGLDAGELAGLTVGHLVRRPEAGSRGEPWTPYLQVRQALAVRGKEGYGTLQTPKTSNRLRDVPIHLAGLLALEEWLDAGNGWERLVCRKPKARDFLFPNAEGAPVRRDYARTLRDDLRLVNALAAAQGLRPHVSEDQLGRIDFKALRRTFSSALKKHRVDEEDRGRLMGHSGRTVTARNYTAHELAELAEKIGRIPLVWGSVESSVVTDSDPSQGRPKPSAKSVIVSTTTDEARMGFEPTYDGFAIRQSFREDAHSRGQTAEVSMSIRPAGIDTADAPERPSAISGDALTRSPVEEPIDMDGRLVYPSEELSDLAAVFVGARPGPARAPAPVVPETPRRRARSR